MGKFSDIICDIICISFKDAALYYIANDITELAHLAVSFLTLKKVVPKIQNTNQAAV